MGISILTEKQQDSKVLVLATYEGMFETWLMEEDKSTRTVKLYLTGLRDFAAWFEQRHDVALSPEQITRLDVRWYRDYLVEERRLKANSVNAYRAAVRAFCRWAVEQDLIVGDPSSAIKGIKISKLDQRPRWLSVKEQEDLLRAAEMVVNDALMRTGKDKREPACMRAYRDQALVELMLNTGLRLSEVAALEVEDVVIRPRSGKVEVRRGKGSKSRTVPLNKEGRQAVAAWLEVREAAGVAAEMKALFVSQKGGALSARSIARRVQRLGQLANVAVTPHQLRHSYAKNLIRAGGDIQDVSLLMGHEDIGTTSRYTVASDTELQRLSERVSRTE